MVKAGHKVGRATSKGVDIQGVPVFHGDASDYTHAGLILKDPTVDLAVLECGVHHIPETGLAFTHCDTGVVVDPLKEDRMRSAAMVVLECICPSGFAILNADDGAIYRMHRSLNCQIAFLSIDAHHPDVLDHIRKGGHVAYVEAGHIVIATGSAQPTVIDVGSDLALLVTEAPDRARHILACVLVGSIRGVPQTGQWIRDMLYQREFRFEGR
jgi:cyanophycin synthetase